MYSKNIPKRQRNKHRGMEIGKVEMFQGFGWGVCRKRQETEGKIRQRLDKWKVLCASHDTTSSKFKKLFFFFSDLQYGKWIRRNRTAGGDKIRCYCISLGKRG